MNSRIHLHKFIGFCCVLAALIVFFFQEAIIEGKILSSADIALRSAVHAPKGYHWEPQHRLLSDAAFQFLPWKEVFHRTIEDEGQLPYLNQYNYCGSPFWANPSAAIFNPLRALVKLSEQPRLWGIVHGLELLLAGLGMYLLAVEMGLCEAARWFGGLIWPFSGFLVVWKLWPHSAAAWPFVWIVLGILLLFHGRLLKSGIIIIIISVFLSWLGGHPETTSQVLFVVSLYAIYLAVKQREYKFLGNYFITVILGTFLAAFFVLPAAHYVLNSYAWSVRVEEGLSPWTITPVHWKMIPGIFFPKIYGTAMAGDLPLYLALGTVNTHGLAGGYVGWLVPVIFLPLSVILRKNILHFKFWISCFVVSLLISINIPFVSNIYKSIPILGAATPIRILYFSGFASLLLAMGVIQNFSQGLSVSLESKIRRFTVFLFLCCSIGIVVGLGMLAMRPIMIDEIVAPRIEVYQKQLPDHSIVATLTAEDFTKRLEKTTVIYPIVLSMTALLAGVGFVLLRKRMKVTSALVAIVTAILIDLFYFGRNYTPAITPASHYPDSPAISFLKDNIGQFRLSATGSNVFAPNLFSEYGLPDIRGYDAIEPREYMEMAVAALGIKKPSHDNFVFLEHKNFSSPLVDILGMKYLVSGAGKPLSYTQTKSVERFKAAWQNEYCIIYENSTVLPGYYFADKIELITDKGERLKRIAEWQGIVKEAILEEPISHKVKTSDGAVGVIKKNSRMAEYNVSVDGDSFLVLAYAWSKGWQAYLSSTPVKLYRVNHGLIGVQLPAGTHTLRIIYSPPWLFPGVFLSFISIIFVVLYIFGVKKVQSKE